MKIIGDFSRNFWFVSAEASHIKHETNIVKKNKKNCKTLN